MLKLLLSSSMDAMLESTRVYGNLSQFKDVRDFIMQNKGKQWTLTQRDTYKRHSILLSSSINSWHVRESHNLKHRNKESQVLRHRAPPYCTVVSCLGWTHLQGQQ